MHTKGFVRLADWKEAQARIETGLSSPESDDWHWSGWMGFRSKVDAEEFVRRWNEHEVLQAKCDKLQAFKDYCHARLDAAGVSADPESSHKAEGCRIGGRLDEVFAVRDELVAALKEAEQLLSVAMERDLDFGRKVTAEIIAGHPGMVKIRAALAFAKPAPTLEDIARGIGESKMRGRGETPPGGG
jgi:hypothetical protein